jgi:hypothetical protein
MVLKSKKSKWVWSLLLSFALFEIFGQGSYINVPNTPDKDNKEAVEKEVGLREFWEVPRYPRPDRLFDWGGWLRSNFYAESIPPIQRGRLFNYDELKLWINLDYQDTHTLYLRLHEKLLFFDNRGDAFGGNPTDWIGPNGDILYYRWKMFKGSRRFVNITVGRKYFYLGNGVVLYNKLDGIQVDVGLAPTITMKSFAGKVIRTVDDFDYLRPNPFRTNRYFAGSELSFSFFPNNPFSIYFLKQFDKNDDRVLGGQTFLYSSWYLGIHSIGKLFKPQLVYNVELIYEGGKSAALTSPGNDTTIKAWASLVTVEYYLSGIISKIHISNFWASGDNDRASPRTSALGSRPGTADLAFGYFGFLSTGLAFFPYFSNIIVTRAGILLKPFEKDETSKFRNLNTGINFYLYHKEKRFGGVLDNAGVSPVNPKKFLGSSVNAFVNWRILSDFAINTEYSLFFPSTAFASTKPRTFFILGVLYEF